MRVVLIPLPYSVKGFIKADEDGYETIVLNSKLNLETNRETFIHEIKHSTHSDLSRECCVDDIELLRHR